LWPSAPSSRRITTSTATTPGCRRLAWKSGARSCGARSAAPSITPSRFRRTSSCSVATCSTTSIRATPSARSSPAAWPTSAPPEGRADWKLLLMHANVEGHTYPGAFEPVIKRDTIARLDADYLLLGHVHSRTHFLVGGTHVLVPGATERMYFEEFGHDPSF